MNIIFVGTTGVHHTLVTAHEYLGTLNDNAFASLKHFADGEMESSGIPIYVGYDDYGNRVYTLGAGNDVEMVKRTLEQLVEILGYSENDLVVKPVRINGDRLIMLLHRLAQKMPLRFLTLAVIVYFIKREIYVLKDAAQAMMRCI